MASDISRYIAYNAPRDLIAELVGASEEEADTLEFKEGARMEILAHFEDFDIVELWDRVTDM